MAIACRVGACVSDVGREQYNSGRARGIDRLKCDADVLRMPAKRQNNTIHPALESYAVMVPGVALDTKSEVRVS